MACSQMGRTADGELLVMSIQVAPATSSSRAPPAPSITARTSTGPGNTVISTLAADGREAGRGGEALNVKLDSWLPCWGGHDPAYPRRHQRGPAPAASRPGSGGRRGGRVGGRRGNCRAVLTDREFGLEAATAVVPHVTDNDLDHACNGNREKGAEDSSELDGDQDRDQHRERLSFTVRAKISGCSTWFSSCW